MEKLKINKILIILIVLTILIFFLIYFLIPKNSKSYMVDLTNNTLEYSKNFANKYKLNLSVKEKYSSVTKNNIIDQSITEGSEIKEGDNLEITVSLGIDYEALKVNELGNVPIMMYHGIHNVTDNQYTGGNVDKDGYQRTTKAFENDLDFYYKNNYRMIRLVDYVNGIVDVEAGKSPIILTFDDGLDNQLKVNGLDENGNIIIDPNSAVGILEIFKKKYPDFNVTATFFINSALFRQSKYNEKILNWLVDNGYDIGNHTYSHADFTNISNDETIKQVGSMYNLLKSYILGKYVNIVALPYGSPYKKDHDNFKYILNGSYDGNNYETLATLRVGWESEVSPFSQTFDKTFLKRVRAYDNNGKDFDIEMNFKILENNRYISDGDKNTITVPKNKEEKVNNIYNLKVVTY